MVNRRVFTVSIGAALQAAGGRPMLRLDSSEASIAFDLLGGGLVDFHRKDGNVNPLTWESKGGAMQPRARGHFLCMDRWGQPSESEKRNGMPFHGEASNVAWKQTGPARMEADLPMAQLHVERTAALDGATLTVRELVTNKGKLGRMYNVVQHPSIAPPFLDERTFVDANVGQGFAQSDPKVVLPASG